MSETRESAIQDHYDAAFQVCYGCGERNADGLKLKSFRDGDEVVAHFRPRPEHLGVPGVVYGGLIASLIDCHGIATGAAHLQDASGESRPPRCVTASLNVEYQRPTPLTDAPIELRARVTDASPRKAVVEVTVIAAGEVTAQGRVVAVRLKEGG